MQTGRYSYQVVVCAAIRCPDGSLLVGPRHFDAVMLAQYRALKLKFEESESTAGFLDQDGKFMTRETAYLVAVAAGQIDKRSGTAVERLFSEDLY